MTEDSDVFVSQRLADQLRKDSGDVPDFGALVGHDDLRDLLILLDNHWSEFSGDSTPDDFRDTQLYQRLVEMYGSRRLLDLLDDGNLPAIGYFLGDDSDRIDASSLELDEFLRYLWHDSGTTDDSCAIYGSRNSAKSSFAYQLVRSLTVHKDATVVSNCRCPIVDHVVTSMTELRDVVLGDRQYINSHYQDGTPPQIDRETDVVWWFAEASSYCKATRHHNQIQFQYFPYMQRFSKLNVNAVYEFHHPMTSHASFRRSDNVGYYIKKPDQKSAVFAESMEEGTGFLKDEIAVLEDIQIPSSHAPDPDDPSPWSWDLPKDETLA
jgi:hypothetical protein